MSDIGHRRYIRFSLQRRSDAGPRHTSGGTYSNANGINDSGQVVGTADFHSSHSTSYGFLYSNGGMQKLGAFFGGFSPTSSNAYGINNSGQVVGSSYAGATGTLAALFSNGTIKDLGKLFTYGQESEAFGINDSGQVVGYSDGRAFLWQSGSGMQDIGTLPNGTGSTAYAINNSGQIAGFTSGVNHAFLYSDGSMQDLGTLLGGTSSYAKGINDSGQVVGCSNSSGGEHAFLYSGGVMVDLNELISPGSGWTLVLATGINDSGQICGWGTNPSGQNVAFLLTPVPEPSTLALLGAGASACWPTLGDGGNGADWASR